MTYLILAIASGTITDLLLKWRLNLKRWPCTVILSLTSILILLKAFDNPTTIVKGFLFAQILIFAGYYDANTKTIPDFVHVLIVVVAMIGINPVPALTGFIAGSLPFLIVGLICGGIGGGDIKLMAASGLVLGGWGITAAGIIGLVMSIVTAYLLKMDKSKGIALGPFLGLGSFISYCIIQT